MKRLLLSGLLGCMLISLIKASDTQLIQHMPNHVNAFVTGSAVPIFVGTVLGLMIQEGSIINIPHGNLNTGITSIMTNVRTRHDIFWKGTEPEEVIDGQQYSIPHIGVTIANYIQLCTRAVALWSLYTTVRSLISNGISSMPFKNTLILGSSLLLTDCMAGSIKRNLLDEEYLPAPIFGVTA